MKSFIAFAAVLACASAQFIGLPAQNFGLGLGLPYPYTTGVIPAAVPAVSAVPAATVVSAPTSTQYHAQDELGQYTYGYGDQNSAKTESRTADGVTRGAYSYVDGNGIVQSVQYVSDSVNGFRVAATNLPVGPAAPAAPVAAAPAVVAAAPVATPFVAAPVQLPVGPVHIAQLPVPVDDTPEVKLAKLQHFQAHAETAARAIRFFK